eukprot:scaffold260_cov274-Pinguiococcus_pyrenoidosus.AAC.4
MKCGSSTRSASPPALPADLFAAGLVPGRHSCGGGRLRQRAGDGDICRVGSSLGDGLDAPETSGTNAAAAKIQTRRIFRVHPELT